MHRKRPISSLLISSSPCTAPFGGLVLIFLRQGPLREETEGFFFVTLFAFASGFSERLAQDMLLASTLGKLAPEKKPNQEPVQAPVQDPALQRAESPPLDAAADGHPHGE